MENPESLEEQAAMESMENPLTVIDMENDVGPGWRPLLHELHAQLTEAGINYEALQVKEKFALLRVYISVSGESHVTFDLTIPGAGTITGQPEQGSSTYDRAMELVYAAEEKSRVICEDCGEPGVLRTDRFWLRTLCDECNGKQSPKVSTE